MMNFFYYIFYSILVTCVSFSLSAQTSISISTVDNDLFITDVVNQNGTTTISSITRNTYTGISASFGFLIKVIYTATNGGRWELQIQDGSNPWQTYYYSTVQSSPKAPSLTFGNWQNGSGGEYSDLDVFSGTGTQTTISACTTPTAYTVTGSGSYCTGGTGVAVGLSNSESGVTYQLKIGGSNDGAAVAGTGSAISFGTKNVAGTYTVVATRTSGACTATMTGSAVVTVNTLPTATASSNSPICAGNTINLTGGGTGTYAWTGPNSFTSTDQNPSFSSATALMAGIYTIRVTNVSGCTSTATTSVTVNAISIGGTVSAAQTICAGTSPANLSLTGNTGTVVKWQKSTDAAFITVADIAGTATTLTGATIGNLTTNTYFRAVVKSGVCAEANSSSVLITVNPLPILNPSSNSPVCSGEQLFLYAKGGNFPSEFPAEFTTYTWTGVNNFTANTRNPTISNVSMSANGIYTVSAVSSANCSATGTILVRVKLTPTLVVSNFTNPTPENNPDGTISFTTNLPNASFSLSYSSTGSPKDVTVSNGAFILNNLVSGIYANFAVTNDGCTGRNNTEVTLLSTPFTLVKSIATGNWESSTTWNIGRVPKAGDVVIIDADHAVTINSNSTIKDMEVRGQLIYSVVGIIINLGL